MEDQAEAGLGKVTKDQAEADLAACSRVPRVPLQG